MPKPSNTTVTVDGDKFNVYSAHVAVGTAHDHLGMPTMGSVQCAFDCVIDVHDTENLPYAIVTKLFNLANRVTREKIVPIKIEFWADENQQDAICTYSFTGWVSNWSMGSGNGANHVAQVSFQPALNSDQFIDLKVGN